MKRTGAMVRQCEHFNVAHPVGSTIRVWPGAMHDGPGTLVTIIMPGAYVLSGHTAVVQVNGGHGCIALDHVEPADAAGITGRGENPDG